MPVDGQQAEDQPATGEAAAVRAISPGEALGAMRDMLAAAGVVMSEDRAQMVQESLMLREQLTSAQAQTEAAQKVDGVPAILMLAQSCWPRSVRFCSIRIVTIRDE